MSSSSKTMMSLKTDKNIKAAAQKLAKEMGFPLSTLINAFLKQFVRHKTVYFSVFPPQTITDSLENELAVIEKDIKQNKNISPQFDNPDDVIKFLNK
jgi:addiction module RelB/DinJ family antitoxin